MSSYNRSFERTQRVNPLTIHRACMIQVQFLLVNACSYHRQLTRTSVVLKVLQCETTFCENFLRLDAANRCEMDIKVQIKQEDPLLEYIASQNEKESYTNYVTVKISHDDVAKKTEIKSETCSTDICLEKERKCFTQYPLQHIKSETVSCINKCKTSEINSQKEKEYLTDNPKVKVKKLKNDPEMDNQIEIKEEPWWLETEASCICDDIEFGDFTPVKYARLCSTGVSGNSNRSAFPSAEDSGKHTSFCNGNLSEYETQETNITETPRAEYVHLESFVKNSNREETNSRFLYYKEKSLFNDDKRQHRCKIHEKRFSVLRDLRNHNLIHEDRKAYKCEIFDKSFTLLKQDLKNHNLGYHEGTKPYKCAICDKHFTHFSLLKRHNLIHDGRKLHKCKTCDKSFTFLSSLKSHNLTHEGRKPYKCEICEKQFAHLSNFRRHKLIHEDRKPHNCEICGKSFTLQSHLKRHKLTHDGKKLHKCEKCGKSFSRPSYLKMHYFIHEGQKPYRCEICDKCFTQLSNLKRHKLSHDGIKPHKCEKCDKSFTRLSNLKTHNLNHYGRKPH